MLAKDIMSQPVVSVDIDERLPVIQKKMTSNGFHHLTVIEKDCLVGIISDRDLLRTISPFIDSVSEQSRDIETLNRAAHQIMTRQPITVLEHSPVKDIIEWMKQVNISCVPVVDDKKHVLGIITWRDLINHAKFH